MASIKEMLVDRNEDDIVDELVDNFRKTGKLHSDCITALKMINEGKEPDKSYRNIMVAVKVLQDCGMIMVKSPKSEV